jgi:hypothetical protein
MPDDAFDERAVAVKELSLEVFLAKAAAMSDGGNLPEPSGEAPMPHASGGAEGLLMVVVKPFFHTGHKAGQGNQVCLDTTLQG